MRPSLVRLFILFAAALFGVLALSLYFLYQLSLSQPPVNPTNDWGQSKLAWIEQIRRFEADIRNKAKNVATHPLTIAAMQKNTERDRLSQTLMVQSFFPEIKNIQLLPLQSDVFKDGNLTLSNQTYGRITAHGAQGLPLGLKTTTSAELLLTTVQPILEVSSSSVLGYVVMESSLEPLQQLFNNLPAAGNYLELQQVNERGDITVLLKRGDENLKLRGKPELNEIANTGWRLAFWPGSSPTRLSAANDSSYQSDFLLISVFAMLVVSLMVVGLYVYLSRLVKSDLMSFLRLFSDMRRHRLRRSYPVKLKEFEETSSIMYRLGKLMMGKQQQFADIASTDHLSQVHNRRSFELKQQELFKTVLAGWSHSLLILDIDNFKEVNDIHGHEAGDALIVQFGKALKDHLRSSDFVARLGGDEFCVIFPNTPLRKAVELAERLRKNMPATLELGPGIIHHLRWSGGLSEYYKDDKTDNAALSRADLALLDAKRAGRNRTQVKSAA